MKCSIHHDLFRTVTTRETKKMKHMMGQKEMRKEEDTHRLLSRAYYNQSTHHHTTKIKKSCDQNAIEINVVLSLVYEKSFLF